MSSHLVRFALLITVFFFLKPLMDPRGDDIRQDNVSLRGIVKDEKGKPIPGAEVVLRSDSTGERRTVSDDQGRFAFFLVTSGSYSLQASRSGYRQREISLDIDIASVKEVTLTLERRSQVRSGGAPSQVAKVKVFFATDRAATGRVEATQFFSGKRNRDGTLTLGSCEVSVPYIHEVGRLESPAIWKLEFTADPSKHVVLSSVSTEGDASFYKKIREALAQAPDHSAFVFVHGYCVSFEDGARRTAQLWYDLGFRGPPILYSWPSRGRLVSYKEDENNVEWSTPHLENFLRRLAAESGSGTIHLIAHSMGNRAVARALESIAKTGLDSAPRFHHVVLTAPDIDAGVFKQLASTMKRVADRITLYASSNDQALLASKWLGGGYPRAGDAGGQLLVLPGIDTIDVSRIDSGLLGHSYYGENRSVVSDLFNLLSGKLPSERFGLHRLQSADGDYWAFMP